MKKFFMLLVPVMALSLASCQDNNKPEDGKEDPNNNEHLTEGYITYAGEKYNVVKMKDGKWWMAENLRYVPEGLTPSSDLNVVNAGVYNPIVLNADHTAVEFSDAEEAIKANGYLYQSETALGVAVGSLTSVAEAEALNGTRGICPEGWHIPTSDEIVALVGKAVSPITTNEEAPYYDKEKANASIALLNADGFNAASWGTVTIANNAATKATLMGWLKANPDIICSGYVAGSTYAGVTYNTANDETSGVKNLQFWAFMPMANNGTFNGAKLNYMSAVSVRCVRD